VEYWLPIVIFAVALALIWGLSEFCQYQELTRYKGQRTFCETGYGAAAVMLIILSAGLLMASSVLGPLRG